MNPFDLGSTILNYYSGQMRADAMEAEGRGAAVAAEFEAMQHFGNAKQRIRSGQVEANNILDQGQYQAAQYRRAGQQAVGNSKVAMVAQGGTVDNFMLRKMKERSDRDAASVLYDSRMNASRARSDAAMDAMQMRSQGRIAQLEGSRAKSVGKSRANWQRLNTVANTLSKWKWKPNFNGGSVNSGAPGFRD